MGIKYHARSCSAPYDVGVKSCSFCAEALVGFQVLAARGEFNLMGHFEHKIIGLGGIQVTITSEGATVKFSLTGQKQGFSTSAVTTGWQ